jgi:hypothetical protein
MLSGNISDMCKSAPKTCETNAIETLAIEPEHRYTARCRDAMVQREQKDANVWPMLVGKECIRLLHNAR